MNRKKEKKIDKKDKVKKMSLAQEQSNEVRVELRNGQKGTQ